MIDIIVFCLPHAGGSKNSYAKLVADCTNNSISFFPIEYKGHASRYNEGLYNNIQEAIEDIIHIITLTNINNNEYLILGNSMGSILALCVCINMEKRNLQLPKCLLLSSSEPPQNIEYFKYNKKELISDISKLGFIPNDILLNKELYEIYSELIYRDLLLDMEGNTQCIGKKVSIPIVALYGNEDTSINPNHMVEWKNYTTNTFILKKCLGNHLFLINGCDDISDFIYKTLKERKII